VTSQETQRLFEEALRAVDRTTDEGSDELLHLAWSAVGIPELEQVLEDVNFLSEGRLTFRLIAGDPSGDFTHMSDPERRIRGFRPSFRPSFQESIDDLLVELSRSGQYHAFGGSSGSSEWFVETAVTLSARAPYPPTVLAQTLFDLSSSTNLEMVLERSRLWNPWAGRHLRNACELAVEARWELNITYSDGFGRNLSFDMHRADFHDALGFAMYVEGDGLDSHYQSLA
jgi:hypothetical protein